MIHHIVTELKSQHTPTGAVFDRFCGPGWTATPAKMLEMLRSGAHQFSLEGMPHLRIVAVRGADGAWAIAIIGPDGKRISPSSLPHWQSDRPRAAPPPKRSFWRSLLDPDAI